MDLSLSDITYRGPAIDDNDILAECPEELEHMLRKTNGLICFKGGLHIRGACHEPAWHSLRTVWKGEHALHRSYQNVNEDDVPFAQDCFGDQYLLRDGEVARLYTENGEVEMLYFKMDEFLRAAERDPHSYLHLHPLVEWQHGDNELHPGELLHVWPPLCSQEAGNGVSLRSMPVLERLAILAELSQQLAAAQGGQQVRLHFENDPRE